jgi:hypothetical protein
VTTGAVTAVTQTGAELRGTLVPGGQTTSWQFEIGRDTGEVQSVPVVPGDAGDGEDSVTVQTVVDGLEPGTTYRYRLVASSAGGTTRGIFRDFTTRKPDTPPPRSPKIGIRLQMAKGTARAGRPFVVRAQIRNRGEGSAQRVVAVVSLPAKLRFLSGTGSCGANGRRVTCRVGGDLSPGRSSVFKLRVRASSAGRLGVSARAESGAPDRSRATASLQIRIQPRK